MSETLIGVAECRNVVVGCIIDVGDYVSDVVDFKKQIESRIHSKKNRDHLKLILRWSRPFMISCIVIAYLATFSNHFTIESITIMEAPVAPTNTNQHAQIGTVVYKIPPTNSSEFPTAVAASQHPCINPCK